MARSRLHRRYGKKRRSSSEPKHNPPLLADLAEWAGPGFASFATTRFLTRIVTQKVNEKKPSWGKHAGVGVSVGSFLLLWYLGHKIKWIAKYHTPITVGSAIAAAQSILQLYLPQVGWMIGDATPEVAAAATAGGATALTARSIPQLEPMPDEDPNEYTYNDSFDPGRYGIKQASAGPGAPAATNSSTMPDLMPDDDLADLTGASAQMGVFTPN